MEHVSFISSIIIRHAGPLASMLAPQIMCMYRLLFFFSSVVSSVEVRLGRNPPPLFYAVIRLHGNRKSILQ